MKAKILVAMRDCANRSTAGPGALRKLMNGDLRGFVLASLALVRNHPNAPGQKQLLTLLVGNDEVMQFVCDPRFFSLEQSMGVTALLAQVEPYLDTKLARLLHRAYGGVGCPTNQPALHRVLELLDAVPASPRTAPALASLLNDPDPRLRAKLAKLVGRRVQNTTFAAEKQQELDPRVRANAIESLWGDKTSSAAEVLWNAAKDRHNRVVGNALLGLYRLEDSNAILSLLVMAADSSPLFRASAAWVMGQTGDPRFLPALEKLARDIYAPVRKNAAAAIGRVVQSMPAASLELRLLRTQSASDGHTLLWMQVLDSAGAPVGGLHPSQFSVWANQQLLIEYAVAERQPPPRARLAFALCLPGAERVLTACLPRKPPEHLWAIAKFYSNENRMLRPPPAAFAAELPKLRTILAQPPAHAKACPFQTLAPLMGRNHSEGHLVLLTAGDLKPKNATSLSTAIDCGLTIHAIVVGDAASPLLDICERSGGMLFSIPHVSEAGPALDTIHSSLANHYRIRYRSPSPAGGRIDVCGPHGRGSCPLSLPGFGV